MSIKPGNFTPDKSDYYKLENSMADAIEHEMNKLLDLDDLARSADNDKSLETRALRRLYVAIARGVMKHLSDNSASITVRTPVGFGPDLIGRTEFDVNWN